MKNYYKNFQLSILVIYFVIIKKSIHSESIKSHNYSVIPNDKYILAAHNECFKSFKLFSCVKYKTSKFLWNLATNQYNYIQNDNSKNENKSYSMVQFVYLTKPIAVKLFTETERKDDETALGEAASFLKRTIDTFMRRLSIRINLPDIDETNSFKDSQIASRGHKKKNKFLVLLPLIILMKIAHLKMSIIPLTLLVAGMQFTIILGGAYLIYYLKHNTLCRIHPHLVQTHSHIYDHDSDYSTFAGGHPYGSSAYGHSHGGVGYKDWGNNRAYNSYNSFNQESNQL